MDNIVGKYVDGKNFFLRDREINQLWGVIEAGSDILITAPKRTGKTSILLYLRDNPREGYKFIYKVVHAVNNEDTFYQLLQEEIELNISTWYRKVYKKFIVVIKKVSKLGFSGASIELDTSESSIAKQKFEHFLKKINLPNNQKLVIMIDEYPEVIENIIREEGESSGIRFIQGFTDIRKNIDLSNVQFIYTGSIGLKDVVGRLNKTNLITDLESVQVRPLLQKDGKKMVEQLIEGIGYEMKDETVIIYLLEKIGWLIPYYIQIFIKELKNLMIDKNKKVVTNTEIDEVLDIVVNIEIYFDHWLERLKNILENNKYEFTKDVLNTASKNEYIEIKEVDNIASRHKLISEEQKTLLKMLVQDGYLIKYKEPIKYSFNSPLIKKWWYEENAS